jgi:hypothetical protein
MEMYRISIARPWKQDLKRRQQHACEPSDHNNALSPWIVLGIIADLELGQL